MWSGSASVAAVVLEATPPRCPTRALLPFRRQLGSSECLFPNDIKTGRYLELGKVLVIHIYDI
jgi:hypothetical protein